MADSSNWLGAQGFYTYVTSANVQWSTWNNQSYIAQTKAVWQTWQGSTTGTGVVRGLGTIVGQKNPLGTEGNGLTSWTITDAYAWSQPLSSEEIARQALEAKELAERYAQQEKERLEKLRLASEKAKAFLVDHLNQEQKEQFEKSSFFELKCGEHVYRIKPGQRVERLDSAGNVLSKFCIHSDYSHKIPPCDQALAHKLLLESQPDYFFKTANETRVAA